MIARNLRPLNKFCWKEKGTAFLKEQSDIVEVNEEEFASLDNPNDELTIEEAKLSDLYVKYYRTVKSNEINKKV